MSYYGAYSRTRPEDAASSSHRHSYAEDPRFALGPPTTSPVLEDALRDAHKRIRDLERQVDALRNAVKTLTDVVEEQTLARAAVTSGKSSTSEVSELAARVETIGRMQAAQTKELKRLQEKTKSALTMMAETMVSSATLTG